MVNKLESSFSISEDTLNQLKQLIPEAFKDGFVDIGALNDALSDYSGEDLDIDDNLFGLYWPGKRQAKKNAATPPIGTLVPVPGDGVDEETTKNIFIEGENLEVLKIIRKAYQGKIKMIYIDPPYNTGKDFIYNDDFSETEESYKRRTGQIDENGVKTSTNSKTEGRFHSNWCSMMYPRLRLSRDLLTDDGVIFISIDDNEVAQLRKICDEIFGEDNFVGTLSVENNPKGRKNSKFISVSSEHLVIFVKSIEKSYFLENIPKKASDMTEDEEGNFVHNSGKRVLVGENSFNKPVENKNSDKNYSVYYNLQKKLIVIEREEFAITNKQLIAEGYNKYYSYNNGSLIENTYTESKFLELFEKGALEFSDDKIYEKNFSDTIRIKSQLVNREYEAIVQGKKIKYSMELTTTGAGTHIKILFKTNEPIFTAPKNIGFLKILISLFINEQFLVLDFFSGSSTTAEAVMKINSEDGGNRKFIMVQLQEEVTQKSNKDAYDFLSGERKPLNICEIGKERIRLAGKKIKETSELNAENLDTGFKVFRLAPSNFKSVGQYNGTNANELPDWFSGDPLVEGWKPENLLTEVMLKEGFPLDSSIVKLDSFNKNKVYQISSDSCGHTLFICLDTHIENDTIDKLDLGELNIFICLDSAITDQVKARLDDKGRIIVI